MLCEGAALILLVLQIAAGVVLGIILAKWLPTLPHKLRVRNYTRSILTFSDNDLMFLAIEGHEQIFSMPNRNWLIEMSFSKDPTKRQDLAARIAADTADRWSKVGSGKGEGMPPLISSDERKELEQLREGMHDLAETIKTAERLGILNAKSKEP